MELYVHFLSLCNGKGRIKCHTVFEITQDTRTLLAEQMTETS